MAYRQTQEFADAVHRGRVRGRGFVSIRKDSWEYAAAARMRVRAQRRGQPFDFVSIAEAADYLNTLRVERCPALGCVLLYISPKDPQPRRTHKPDSASVDCVIPFLGYARGNIRIISNLANSMKRDATTAEIRAFAAWVLS